MTSNDDDRWAWLAEGNRTQARKRVATKVLLRDTHDRLLLVDPAYKAYWDLPGGMAEDNENPRASAARELREELGVHVRIGELLVVDWIGPHGPWDDQLVLVFDGGRVDTPFADTIRPYDAELTDTAWCAIDDALHRLRPDIAERTRQALAAAADGHTRYNEQQRDRRSP